MIDHVRQKIKLQEGEWLVSYVTLASCGCRYDRHSIKINSKREPSLKKIQDAVNNQRES